MDINLEDFSGTGVARFTSGPFHYLQNGKALCGASGYMDMFEAGASLSSFHNACAFCSVAILRNKMEAGISPRRVHITRLRIRGPYNPSGESGCVREAEDALRAISAAGLPMPDSIVVDSMEAFARAVCAGENPPSCLATGYMHAGKVLSVVVMQ